MFRSSRTFPFVVSLAAMVCALGILGQAQNAEKPRAALSADDFNQFSWRWVGPTTFSGRITAFAVPRGQSQTYYVLTASSGVWKTVDAGIHFEPIFEKYGTGSMGWMAIAPSDPNILYLGTGEPMHARASTHGNGMWKSTDAGRTWTHIGLEKSHFIPMVAVDSRNPDLVFAAAEGRLYDNEMDCERGLFKSTDGGKTWTNIFAHVKDRGVGDFVIDPRNSDVIVAAAYRTYRRAWTYDDWAAGNGLYKTADGGRTWKKLAPGLPAADVPLGRIGLTLFEKNPTILYARVDEEVNLGYPERDGVANFRAPVTTAGPGGGGGFGAGAANFRPDFAFAHWKAFKLQPEVAKLLPKLSPIAADTEADLVKQLNEAVADRDFLAKNAIDLAKLAAVVRKVHAKDEATLKALDELERLAKKPAPAADSAEAKGRSQTANRLTLELLYAGALNNFQPTRRNGVVYRSDDQGETWKRMTEYVMPAGGGPGAAPGGAPGGQQAAGGGRGGAQAGSAQVNQTEGGC